MSVPAPAAAASEHLHADGVNAFQAGDLETAADLLAQRCARISTPSCSTTARSSGRRRRPDRARALLRTCLTLDAGNVDARRPREIHQQPRDARSWRSSKTLGGTDATMPERAYPGHAERAGVMREHAPRYAIGAGLLAGDRRRSTSAAAPATAARC